MTKLIINKLKDSRKTLEDCDTGCYLVKGIYSEKYFLVLYDKTESVSIRLNEDNTIARLSSLDNYELIKEVTEIEVR